MIRLGRHSFFGSRLYVQFRKLNGDLVLDFLALAKPSRGGLRLLLMHYSCCQGRLGVMLKGIARPSLGRPCGRLRPRSGPARGHTKIHASASLTPGFLIHDFLVGRRSSILGIWAAPGGLETFQKGGGCAPRLFGGFPGRPGPPRPPKSTFSGRSKNHVLKTQVYCKPKRTSFILGSTFVQTCF